MMMMFGCMSRALYLVVAADWRDRDGVYLCRAVDPVDRLTFATGICSLSFPFYRWWRMY